MSIMKKIENSYGKFTAIREHRAESTIEKFSDTQYQKLCKIYKNNDYMVTVEWIARHYLASKKISLAALYFTQAEALADQGMKNLSFYCDYYSLFSALSANLLLNTDFKLENTRSISHAALAKNIENYYVRPGLYDKNIIKLLTNLRFCRELYSYHLPISGRFEQKSSPLDASKLHEQLGNILPACLQLSDLNSYLSHFAWKKENSNIKDSYAVYHEEVEDLFWSIVKYSGPSNLEHYDDGDYGLLGYFIKSGEPLPITWIINDKVLEEVESGWDESESETVFHISSIARYLSKVTHA